MKVDWMDVEELAAAMMGLSGEADSDEIENKLFDKYDVSFESFQKIIGDLMPFTITAKAAISGEEFHGFVKDGSFMCRAPVEAK